MVSTPLNVLDECCGAGARLVVPVLVLRWRCD
jgi:hypothetical protein